MSPAGIFEFFKRMGIAKKLMVGFLGISAITVVLGVFALSSLNSLNRLNRVIIDQDIPRIGVTDKLTDMMLEEERLAGKVGIFRSSAMQSQAADSERNYRTRTDDFVIEARKLEGPASEDKRDVETLIATHRIYITILDKILPLGDLTSSKKGKEIEARIKEKQGEIRDIIRGIDTRTRKGQEERLRMSSMIGKRSLYITVVLCFIALVAGGIAAFVIMRSIATSVATLKAGAHMVAEGKFTDLPVVRTRDELGELSRAFVEMADRVKRLEELSLDASPLTHLPGGVAVESVLKRRVDAKAPLSFMLMDMDNFKAYNDHYGYARGNDIIKGAGRVIESAVRSLGNPEDFVGHIGGDDFAVVTTPDKHSAICRDVIEKFDKMALEAYDAEDRERGYILGVTRQGLEVHFPLVSLSIAVVTNLDRELSSHIQVGEIAAELKEYAKSIQGSVFVVDNRRRRD